MISKNKISVPSFLSLLFLVLALISLWLIITKNHSRLFNNRKTKQNNLSSINNFKDWKTFYSLKSDYSFQYPPTWYEETFDGGNKIIYNADQNVTLAVSSNIKNIENDNKSCWVKIPSSQQFITDNFTSIQSSSYDAVYVGDKIECSLPYYKIARRIELIMEKDNSKYRLSYSYDKNKEQEYLKILRQILTTFRFAK